MIFSQISPVLVQKTICEIRRLLSIMEEEKNATEVPKIARIEKKASKMR
jgi:hypothetical protein